MNLIDLWGWNVIVIYFIRRRKMNMFVVMIYLIVINYLTNVNLIFMNVMINIRTDMNVIFRNMMNNMMNYYHRTTISHWLCAN
jgi:hypothetical protein